MVLSVAVRTMSLSQRSWNSLGAKGPPLVPGNLCVVCFLEGTRFPLQHDGLSEQPILLLM